MGVSHELGNDGILLTEEDHKTFICGQDLSQGPFEYKSKALPSRPYGSLL
jgi:hypothetical protein